MRPLSRVFNHDPYAARRKPPRPGRPRAVLDGTRDSYSLVLPPLPGGDLVRTRVLFVTARPGGRSVYKTGPSARSVELSGLPEGSSVTAYVLDRTVTGESSDPGDVLNFVATYEPPARPGPLRLKSVERLGPPRPGRPWLSSVERLGPPRPGLLAITYVEAVT